METECNVVVVKQEFKADSDDSITLSRGDLVEVLKTDFNGNEGINKRNVSNINADQNIRWYVRMFSGGECTKEGWVPIQILDINNESSSVYGQQSEDPNFRRLAIIQELVETEEEFGKDLQNVVDRYIKAVESPSVPRTVRDNKDIIFGNFQQIAEFHHMVLIEGVKYYADKPNMVAKTFLRLERDFDMHVRYCTSEPHAQELLKNNKDAQQFFQEISNRYGDDKSLSEHLKLPIQRINDYQFLLKDLLKNSQSLSENVKDLQKALELMLSVPNRAFDNKFLTSIEGYRGNIQKIGRLLLHEWWTITDKYNKAHDRYLFLFKSRILICKVRKINEERSVFILQDIIKLPDCIIEDRAVENAIFLSKKVENKESCLPIAIKPHKNESRSLWYREICSHIDQDVTLQEHNVDDLRVSSIHVFTDGQQVLHLPHKAEAHNPETGIKASDVAQDCFLSKEEKERLRIEHEELLKLESESIQRLENFKRKTVYSIDSSNKCIKQFTQSNPVELNAEPNNRNNSKEHKLEKNPTLDKPVLNVVAKIPEKNESIEKAEATPITDNSISNAQQKIVTQIATHVKSIDQDSNVNLITDTSTSASIITFAASDERHSVINTEIDIGLFTRLSKYHLVQKNVLKVLPEITEN